MDKKYVVGFYAGSVVSLGTILIVRIVQKCVYNMKCDKLTKKAYKIMRDAFDKDPEFAEYCKENNPETYQKIMGSK